ncbi:protein phosphatase 1L-like [Ostrea edulis]|uniref:protein phosphatase 1L-like n=1 Tax=Ostrea edulis TaxID=37623 RepID=UPI002095DD31|nr:protein phosphatase 1L-like [Ostrea edulis]
MTAISLLSRFLRKYVFSVEALLLLGLVFFLYHSVYHSKPLWRYIFPSKEKKISDVKNKDPAHDVFPPKRSEPTATWELQKDGAAGYAIQGRRPHMEDRLNIVSDLEQTGTSIYGVFDGHGGEFAADFTEKTLFKYLMVRMLSASLDEQTVNFTQMITEEVLRVDKKLQEIARTNSDISGTTALFTILKEDILTVANVGDSRGVLCDKNGTAIPLSYDHKPYNVKERQRIKDVGGFISFNGVWRVAGVLATSRALGDYPLKDTKMVIAEPDILTFNLRFLQPYFMILASDGLWDVFSNQEAVDFVKGHLNEPFFGAKSLVLQAYYKGSLDNISVVVVNFSSDGISRYSSKQS